MEKIKIDFCDFWGGFNKTDNYFYNLLKEKFEIEISNKPDFLFFSIFGNESMNYQCKKIFYTGENIAPPLHYCDYAFSFDYLDNPRNYRLPHYMLYDGYYDLINKKVDESLINRKFCNFLVNNGGCEQRNKFFHKLSKYKKVDSGGKLFNNLGYEVNGKRNFQKDYKFTIAYENNAYRPQWIGYTTEKIMEPMVTNSIPIYWGNPRIDLEFNTKSFVNFYDFKSEEDMIDYIIELDQDDKKYFEVLQNNWFVNNIIPETNKIESIKSFLYKIFEK
jgi:hypothetical protein